MKRLFTRSMLSTLMMGIALFCGIVGGDARAEFNQNFFNQNLFARNLNPLSTNSGQFFRNGFTGFNSAIGSGLTGANNLGRVVGAGLFNVNGNLDLSAAIPQTAANFSRVAQVNNLNVGNQNELNLRSFVTDPKSGFTIQQARLEPFTGLLQSRPADAFGNRFNNFQFGGLDNEASRQLQKFFLENITNKTVNNLEKRLRGFNNNELLELLGATNLARQSLGPQLSAGTIRVQCQDVLVTAVNDDKGQVVDPDYARMTAEDRCIATVSAALNHVKPFGRPPVRVDKSMLSGGVLTIPNLLNTFSLPALAVLFKKADNTNICNFEQASANPVWSMEDLVMQVMNPAVYNLAKGFDAEDVNRNLFLQTGVNLALPRQFMTGLGAQLGLFASNLTDIAFIDGRQSKVTKSGLTRELRAWANQAGRVFFSFDTNAEKSGVQLASQNIRQTGRNNLGFGQGEGWRQDPTGAIDWLLTAAPAADGKIPLANEVPATAAHTGSIANGSTSAVIANGQCIQCHRDGVAITDRRRNGNYSNLGVSNTNGVGNLSANFSNARAAYINFKKLTNQYIPDSSQPGSSKEILWDVYQKVKQPKSINYAANQVGLSGDQLRQLMVQDPTLPLKLQLDEKGNIDTQNWLGGGKCAVKFALKGRRGGGVSNGALASTVGPQGVVGNADGSPAGSKPAAPATNDQPHS